MAARVSAGSSLAALVLLRASTSRMTYGAVAPCDSATHDEDTPAQKALPQALLGGIALAVIAFACGWTLYANLAGTDHNAILAGPTVTISTVRPAPAVAPRSEEHTSELQSLAY